MRKLVLLGLAQALLVLALAGCGGGSSGVITSPSNNGTGGNQSANAVAITVDSGPDPSAFIDVDTPFITVTVCAPGSTTNCQQINHVEVDTGSYGFRVMSSVLNSSLASALQQQVGTGGNPIVECTQFADGYSWGPVKLADMQVGGESASAVPIQVIGDSSFKNEIPTACSGTGTEEDTVAAFGANAILGVGVFADDCGSNCATNPNFGFYYTCPTNGASTSSCAGVLESEQDQVTDPAAFFHTDNNGVIVELPAASQGATGASGTLIFGIGTESNNSLGSQTVLTANNASSNTYGSVSTTYTTQGGQQLFLPFSYFDTGSNAYYFGDDSIPSVTSCSNYPGYNSSTPESWFCPASELKLSATNAGQNGIQSTVSFSIGNAYTLFNASQSGTIFDDLGASSGSPSSNCTSQSTATTDVSCSFDFGFPFFLGRKVYIAFAGANTAWGTGPYFAY